MTSAFVYDYLLTLHLEIKLIWFSRWNYTKILFLVFRYMPFIQIWLTLHNQTFVNVSTETCKTTFPMQTWFVMLQMVLAEVILAFRTWAVWNRNKTVGALLVVSILATIIPQCILTNSFIRSIKYAPAPYSGFRGCFATTTSHILWANFTSIVITEAICLVLMVISAFQSYRLCGFGRLSLIIHRDGIISYVYMLCISIANMAIEIAAPLDPMDGLLTPYEYLLYSVLTARIILNIRDAGNRNLQTDLHSTYQEVSLETIPIHFASRHQLKQNA